MSQRYLLKCPECDQANKVVAAQAGQKLSCVECGGPIDVGTLRDIRQLPAVEEPNAAKSKSQKQTWSTSRRWGFVAGLAVLVIGSIWGITSLIAASGEYAERPPYELTEEQEAGVDMATPAKMFEAWSNLPDADALDVWDEPEYLAAQAQAARTRTFGYIGLAIAGLGILAMLITLFVRF